MSERTAVLAILLFAVLARFPGLDSKVFWHDELYTTSFVAGYQSHDWEEALFTGEVLPVTDVHRFLRSAPDRSLWDTVRGLAADEPQHPPGYYSLARLWTRLLGDGYARLRLLSALLGLLAVPAGAWLAWEVFGDRRAALLAALLLAASPFFVLYSQEAREYAAWSTLTLLANAQLLRSLREGGGANWLGFSLLTAASLYTALSSAGVILGQVLYVVLRERRPTRTALSAAAAMAFAAALFLPWALVLQAGWASFSRSMEWSRVITVPRWELLSLFGSNLSRALVDFWHDAHGEAWVAVAAAVAVLAWGAVDSLRRDPKTALLLATTATIPIAMLLVPDLLFGGIRSISARYVTPTLLGLLILLAGALVRRPRLAAAVALVMVASCVHNARLDTAWTKGISLNLGGVRDAVASVEEPLVIAHLERHHPGNLLALAATLQEGHVQFLRIPDPDPSVPPGHPNVFLLSPNPDWRAALEARGHRIEPLHHDLHLELWRVH